MAVNPNDIVEVTSAKRSSRNKPASRWFLSRVLWGVSVLHVAAFLAFVAAAGGGGNWVVNGDATHSDCSDAMYAETGFSGDVAMATVSDWPITMQCYKVTYDNGRETVPVTRLKASVIQSAGCWFGLVSLGLIPLSWILLAATALVVGVLELIRRIRGRPRSGNSGPVAASRPPVQAPRGD